MTRKRRGNCVMAPAKGRHRRRRRAAEAVTLRVSRNEERRDRPDHSSAAAVVGWRSSSARGPGPARLPGVAQTGRGVLAARAPRSHTAADGARERGVPALMGQERVAWINRAQFFGVAAQAMRRILVDHAREREAAKRPGGIRVTLDEGMRSVAPIDCELLMLDSVLQELAAIDPRQARIVEMRYFGGLSEEEVAAILSLSRATITREWQSARAWLYRRMTVGRTARS